MAGWIELDIDSQRWHPSKPVPVVLLAGGIGSRMGSTRPKGCTPISPIRQASLFQLFAEQVVSVSQLYGSIELIIWTNRYHYQDVLQLFNDNAWFGLNVEQVQLICQPERPYLDPKGAPVEVGCGQLLTGPCGNGIVWHTLKQCGVLERWLAQQVDYVRVVPIDNALAKVYVPQQLSLARNNDLGVVLECVRRFKGESVGVINLHAGHIVEYSADSHIHADLEGFPWGFSGASLWSLTEVCRIADRLPQVHKVLKSVALPDGSMCKLLKQEYFIFDLLAQIARVAIAPVSRQSEFCPLKQMEGPCGVVAVQQALLRWYRQRARELGCVTSDAVQECMPLLWFAQQGRVTLDRQGMLSLGC